MTHFVQSALVSILRHVAKIYVTSASLKSRSTHVIELQKNGRNAELGGSPFWEVERRSIRGRDCTFVFEIQGSVPRRGYWEASGLVEEENFCRMSGTYLSLESLNRHLSGCHFS